MLYSRLLRMKTLYEERQKESKKGKASNEVAMELGLTSKRLNGTLTAVALDKMLT